MVRRGLPPEVALRGEFRVRAEIPRPRTRELELHRCRHVRPWNAPRESGPERADLAHGDVHVRSRVVPAQVHRELRAHQRRPAREQRDAVGAGQRHRSAGRVVRALDRRGRGERLLNPAHHPAHVGRDAGDAGNIPRAGHGVGGIHVARDESELEVGAQIRAGLPRGIRGVVLAPRLGEERPAHVVVPPTQVGAQRELSTVDLGPAGDADVETIVGDSGIAQAHEAAPEELEGSAHGRERGLAEELHPERVPVHVRVIRAPVVVVLRQSALELGAQMHAREDALCPEGIDRVRLGRDDEGRVRILERLRGILGAQHRDFDRVGERIPVTDPSRDHVPRELRLDRDERIDGDRLPDPAGRESQVPFLGSEIQAAAQDRGVRQRVRRILRREVPCLQPGPAEAGTQADLVDVLPERDLVPGDERVERHPEPVVHQSKGEPGRHASAVEGSRRGAHAVTAVGLSGDRRAAVELEPLRAQSRSRRNGCHRLLRRGRNRIERRRAG